MSRSQLRQIRRLKARAEPLIAERDRRQKEWEKGTHLGRFSLSDIDPRPSVLITGLGSDTPTNVCLPRCPALLLRVSGRATPRTVRRLWI